MSNTFSNHFRFDGVESTLNTQSGRPLDVPPHTAFTVAATTQQASFPPPDSHRARSHQSQSVAPALEPKAAYPHPLELRTVHPPDRRWSSGPASKEGSAVRDFPMPEHGAARSHSRHGSSQESLPGGLSRYPSSSAQPYPQFAPRERQDSHSGPGLPPPRSSSQASVESDHRPTRTLASVHSILNPSSGEDAEARGRRRSAAQMEEDQFSPPTGAVQLSRPGSSGGPHGETSPRSGLPRRILTPISPTLHRPVSMSKGVSHSQQATGTIDAQSMPFLGPSSSSGAMAQPAETSSHGPPVLPPLGPHVAQRQSFSYSQMPTPPIQYSSDRRNSVSALPSARASPSPSTYSSYSRSGHPSPQLPYPPSAGPTPPGSFSLGPSPVTGPLSNVPPVSLDVEMPHGIPVVSAGQTAFEVFTIESGRGPVSLPVEVQVASRQADEKRKRNAGASARFRQRRKEKEREANVTIDKLSNDLRIMSQDAQYYKQERDRYLDIVKTMPDWERHLPRSPSPHTKRGQEEPLVASTERATPASPQSATDSDYTRVAESDRSIRRRTEAYSLPLPSPPARLDAPQFHSPLPPFSPTNTGPPQHRPPFSPTSVDPPSGLPRGPYSEAPANSNYRAPWPPQQPPAPGHP